MHLDDYNDNVVFLMVNVNLCQQLPGCLYYLILSGFELLMNQLCHDR